VNVGIVTTSYPRFRGDHAGSFVASLASSLVAAGVGVEVWAPHAAGLAAEELLDGVLVRRFRYAPPQLERVAYGDGVAMNVRHDRAALAALPSFMRALRHAGAEAQAVSDVVHVNWAPVAAAMPRSSVPLVLTVHGSDVQLALRGRVWRDALRAAMRRATRVIAVSSELGETLGSIAGEMLPPLDVVPTGVERELLDRERVTRHARGPLRLAYVGRLLASKGVFDLADAFRLLDRDATLTVAGDGPAAGPLAWRFLTADCERRVRFLGGVPRPEALDVLADADLVIVPSHAEGCGVVAVEASALGTPVVASRVGIHPDILSEVALFEPGDVVGLAARIELLADDPALRRTLADEAEARVAAGMTWDVLAGRVIEVYEKALAGAAS
jgi:glycosyltransferase involved in cell wall biosynthesis